MPAFRVHTLRFGKIEVFNVCTDDALQTVVDRYEGQVGAVLAVYDGETRVFQGPYEAFDQTIKGSSNAGI